MPGTMISADENRFALLSVNADEEVSFQVMLDSALSHLSVNQAQDQTLKGVVTAVVAAFMPVITNLQTTVNQLQRSYNATNSARDVLQDHEFRQDELEQYSKWDNIIINGIPESEEESTNDVVIKLAKDVGIEITHQNLSTSHRLGKPRGGKPRPIVAKFVRRDVRTSILKSKKELMKNPASRKIFIGEHLTPLRAKLLKKVREDNSVTRAWTVDCKVVCLAADNRKHTLTSPKDLQTKLNWSTEKIEQAGLFLKF